MTEHSAKRALEAPWRIGVDVGGTFTDLVLVDHAGSMHVIKVPSTPSEPSIGVIAALEQTAAKHTLTCQDLLKGCQHFFHASTIATNIVLERRAPPVGMLVSKGFRDSIAIRRGIRQNAWAHRVPFPPVLSPRYLRLPVQGRLDRRGREIEPLSEHDIRCAVESFRREGVRSVAICLYNSFLNDAHELRASEILAAEFPDASLTLSSHIAPVMGEYERSSTAVLNAYVAHQVVEYMKRLSIELSGRGLTAPILVVQNNGGSLTIEKVEQRPVSLLLSGPAAGAGALSLYSQALDLPDLISMEIGGTSCDVTLVSNATIELATAFELGGYHVAMPSIDIHSVGAGGGTIAGVDRGGMLFVGPQGTGAMPGPAAYDLGGEEPTPTDAQLVLGRLKPGKLASGRSLDLDRAKDTIVRKIATPLGLSTDAAAAGILRLIEQELLHAVQKISAERGHDPRRFVLVAAGGAGPMHGASIGRKLNSAAVYVPRLAGAFCALGMMNAPIKHEFGRAFITVFGKASWPSLEIILTEFEAKARRQLQLDGFGAEACMIVRELDLRHPGQIASLRIEIPAGHEINWLSVGSAFLSAHIKLYGHADPTALIEVSNVRVVGMGRLSPLHLGRSSLQESVPHAYENRLVFFEQTAGRAETKIYRGADLCPGAEFEGPAIVEEPTTTVVIGPGDICSVDEYGNYVIRFKKERSQ